MKTTGHLFVVFDALNIVKGIKTIGGSENQTYYIESKKFVPDRRLTPLIWQPYIYVTDPNGIIPEGDKVKELASSAWYIGYIEPSNRVTAKEDTATIDTPFAVDSNNALHVRKNTDKPIQVFFEAEYLDTRKNKTVQVSLTAMISSTSNSEEKPAPKLSLSKPQSWKYSPFENINKDVVEAKLSQDGQLLSSAVEWCKVENDIEIPLSEKDAFYLGGQNSDKLQVNPSLMPSTLLRARQLSEDVYNRFYGINPKWDGSMDIDTLKSLDYRNLVVNGDFMNASDAPWLANWSVTLDKGKITSKSGYMDISQPYRAIVGHLYYGRIKVNKDYIHLVFSNRSWESRKNIVLNDGEDYDYFKEISGIGSPVEETTYISLMAYPGSGGKEKIWTVEYCYLIDLTEKFGKGNEPTKEQCDEIFEHYGYIPAPEDLAKDGIIKGSYQSDIKFTRYLPKLDTSIEFLTGDTLRAGMTSVRMKAVVKTNKELISNPDKYFDIKWYLEPSSAGAKEEFLGSGEEIEVPVSKIEIKGGRFIPFRFDLKEKLL